MRREVQEMHCSE
jgi:fatty-acyl-CoA synthase